MLWWLDGEREVSFDKNLWGAQWVEKTASKKFIDYILEKNSITNKYPKIDIFKKKQIKETKNCVQTKLID